MYWKARQQQSLPTVDLCQESQTLKNFHTQCSTARFSSKNPTFVKQKPFCYLEKLIRRVLSYCFLIPSGSLRIWVLICLRHLLLPTTREQSKSFSLAFLWNVFLLTGLFLRMQAFELSFGAQLRSFLLFFNEALTPKLTLLTVAIATS